MLLAALAATKHASEHVREASFALLRELATHQAAHFDSVLDVVVQPLLLGCADSSREVGGYDVRMCVLGELATHQAAHARHPEITQITHFLQPSPPSHRC